MPHLTKEMKTLAQNYYFETFTEPDNFTPDVRMQLAVKMQNFFNKVFVHDVDMMKLYDDYFKALKDNDGKFMDPKSMAKNMAYANIQSISQEELEAIDPQKIAEAICFHEFYKDPENQEKYPIDITIPMDLLFQKLGLEMDEIDNVFSPEPEPEPEPEKTEEKEEKISRDEEDYDHETFQSDLTYKARRAFRKADRLLYNSREAGRVKEASGYSLREYANEQRENAIRDIEKFSKVMQENPGVDRAKRNYDEAVKDTKDKLMADYFLLQEQKAERANATNAWDRFVGFFKNIGNSIAMSRIKSALEQYTNTKEDELNEYCNDAKQVFNFKNGEAVPKKDDDIFILSETFQNTVEENEPEISDDEVNKDVETEFQKDIENTFGKEQGSVSKSAKIETKEPEVQLQNGNP